MVTSLKYIEHETGKATTVVGGTIVPLQYEALKSINLNGKIQIEVKWKNAVVTESEFEHTGVSSEVDVTATINSNYSSQAVGLVAGGWLPAGMALDEGMLLLPDRNTVTYLRSRFF